MDFGRISRRRLLQGSAALTLGTAFGTRSASAADTTIGFIYVGSRDDYGYNQAHAQGAARSRKCHASSGRGRESPGKPDAVERTIESMIQSRRRNAACSRHRSVLQSAHDQMRNKFPKLRFEHCGGCGAKGSEGTPAAFRLHRRGQYISSHRSQATPADRTSSACGRQDPFPQVVLGDNIEMLLRSAPSSPIRKPPTQWTLTGDWSMPGQGSRSDQQP